MKILLVTVLLVVLAYGGWQFRRWFNMEYGYKTDIEKIIKEMVKPEALK